MPDNYALDNDMKIEVSAEDMRRDNPGARFVAEGVNVNMGALDRRGHFC